MWKIWNKHKVYAVSIQDVEYVDFYYCSKPPKYASKIFQSKLERAGMTIDFPLSSHNNNERIRIKLGKLKLRRHKFLVNCNIATAGHKLPGVSTDILIHSKFVGYGFENWVYVVLWRVQTRSWLLLNEKLDLKTRSLIKVPEKLLKSEEGIEKKERQHLKQFQDVDDDMYKLIKCTCKTIV